MKKLFTILLLIVFFSSFLTTHSDVYAQTLRCNPGGHPPGSGINTAIGCIPVLTGDPDPLVGTIIRWAVGIAGGIAFLLVLYAGFQITTSTGHPDKIQAGKELLTAAIAGLLLIIFSVFLLHIIGVRIFRLPGF